MQPTKYIGEARQVYLYSAFHTQGQLNVPLHKNKHSTLRFGSMKTYNLKKNKNKKKTIIIKFKSTEK